MFLPAIYRFLFIFSLSTHCIYIMTSMFALFFFFSLLYIPFFPVGGGFINYSFFFIFRAQILDCIFFFLFSFLFVKGQGL
ncbi:hypothetical protein DFH27DRAFT_149872 [Peziza echinospora]|nr:hypothetical protein DFH27DRAFT_149872 [Peziza echinospora]